MPKLLCAGWPVVSSSINSQSSSLCIWKRSWRASSRPTSPRTSAAHRTFQIKSVPYASVEATQCCLDRNRVSFRSG
jgi:hypothetical protein